VLKLPVDDNTLKRMKPDNQVSTDFVQVNGLNLQGYQLPDYTLPPK
jgi:hypothetical protein